MPITRSGMISNNIGTTNSNNNQQQQSGSGNNIFSNNNNANNKNSNNNIFSNNNSNKPSNNIFSNNNTSKNILNNNNTSNNNTNNNNNIFNNNNNASGNNSSSRNIFNNNNTSNNSSSNNNNNSNTKNNIFTNNNNSTTSSNNIFTNKNNSSNIFTNNNNQNVSSQQPTFYDPAKQKDWINSLRFNTKQMEQHFDYLKLKCSLYEIDKAQQSQDMHFIMDRLKKAFEVRIKDVEELNKQLVENVNKRQLKLGDNTTVGKSSIFSNNNNYNRNTTSRNIFNNSNTSTSNNIFSNNNTSTTNNIFRNTTNRTSNTSNIFSNNNRTTTTTSNNIFSSNSSNTNNKNDQIWLPLKKEQYYTCYQQPIMISQQQLQHNVQRVQRIREKNTFLILTIVKLKAALQQRLRLQQQPYQNIYSSSNNHNNKTTKTINQTKRDQLNSLCDSILYMSRAISNKLLIVRAQQEGKKHKKQLMRLEQIEKLNKTEQQLLQEKLANFNPQKYILSYINCHREQVQGGSIKHNQQQQQLLSLEKYQQLKQNSISTINLSKLSEYKRQEYNPPQENKVKQSRKRVIQTKRQQHKVTPQKKDINVTCNFNNNNKKKDQSRKQSQQQQQKTLQINYFLTLLTQAIPKLQQKTKFYQYEMEELSIIRDEEIGMKDNQQYL